jgi:tetratricopeptide (TPR) repeat protein
MRLHPLTEPELSELLDGLSREQVHAVWLASGGLPGAALTIADQLAGSEEGVDAIVHLALTTQSSASFLDFDIGLERLLEAAAQRPMPPATRARVLARLARELLGDPAARQRRQALIEEAVTLARADGSPGTIAEVLESGLHALWDPAGAGERLATAAEIIEQARAAGDGTTERRGLFWRFTALAELGQLDNAQTALTEYARASELAGDAEAGVVVLARKAMLATVRGDFDGASMLTDEVAVLGRNAGLADTERIVGSLNAGLVMMRGDVGSLVARWRNMDRRLPGHFFSASAARAMAESGRDEEAALELERLLPTVLAGSGPRWLGAVADLAVVASRADDPAPARSLYQALLPYRGRLVVYGGAATITGPVDEYLGRLATRLGELDQAVAYFDTAAELERRIGALPWLAQTLVSRSRALSARGGGDDHRAARDDLAQARSIAEPLGMRALLGPLEPPVGEWRLSRDGDDWILQAGAERARLRDTRGMHYLRLLLAAPGQEISALDLVAGGDGLPATVNDPLLDDTARDTYRRRLNALGEQLDAADRAGDADRAQAAEKERNALLDELRRSTGLGGRSRAHADAAERARVNATRAVWAAVTRVESVAPAAGGHLRSSLHTGRFFRYQPAPGGPARWRV